MLHLKRGMRDSPRSKNLPPNCWKEWGQFSGRRGGGGQPESWWGQRDFCQQVARFFLELLRPVHQSFWMNGILHVRAEVVSVSKTRKNIQKSDEKVTVELYGHFRCLQVPYSKWNYIQLEIPWVRQYLVNFTCLEGIVNATRPSQFSQVSA